MPAISIFSFSIRGKVIIYVIFKWFLVNHILPQVITALMLKIYFIHCYFCILLKYSCFMFLGSHMITLIIIRYYSLTLHVFITEVKSLICRTHH